MVLYMDKNKNIPHLADIRENLIINLLFYTTHSSIVPARFNFYLL